MTNGILESRHGQFLLQDTEVHLHRANHRILPVHLPRVNQSCSCVDVLGAWVLCPPPKQLSLGRDDLTLTNAIQKGKDVDQ